MLSRLKSAFILSVGLLAAGLTVTTASAQQRYDERVYGGGRQSDLPSFFGAMFGTGGGRAIPRQTVSYPVSHAPGTIVISTSERRLYLMVAPGQAIRYGVGVGRQGFQWAGTKAITRKAEWPSWTPPAQMLRRRPDLPRFMKGGQDNPLGARAMYLGSSLYRIHGSNEPETIGTAVSSGCIRMTNDDVIDLYNRVRVGTRVIVTR
ncbi:putative L,D-transpeptidase ErfK/SrfK precursor [Variibacter gotjawalensis]|uniref:Putative L,D-transpeptidase ErfK/SrfK n=1 Tax=Variibacter gotjawalensis TaxID=1333996 RepID=A0A0S3PZ06_9BRAD|nr:L,D-transpeptidase [Variibacter gotjawalensis]NIK46995.1 lipoprotein-anchoring transpeptidase ErfK/SrfK [Variibacter gotjawalensis]RZS48899.1 L,D-transpeptidase-like protein [Variibacter gotjawalensis]BAT61158.1 putative L,D-transpeptidase ErfK/SrfK precursor [Variibacter gotjawalensis]